MNHLKRVLLSVFFSDEWRVLDVLYWLSCPELYPTLSPSPCHENLTVASAAHCSTVAHWVLISVCFTLWCMISHEHQHLRAGGMSMLGPCSLVRGNGLDLHMCQLNAEDCFTSHMEGGREGGTESEIERKREKETIEEKNSKMMCERIVILMKSHQPCKWLCDHARCSQYESAL